jgi:hypothetical protein
MWGVNLPRVKVCPDTRQPVRGGRARLLRSRPRLRRLVRLPRLGQEPCAGGARADQDLRARRRHHHPRRVDDAEPERPRAHGEAAAVQARPTYALRKNTATAITPPPAGKLKPLPASQTTVRGPHPPLQLLDEVDEMEDEDLQAALGQAMEQINSRGKVIGEYIVASSTWQNPRAPSPTSSTTPGTRACRSSPGAGASCWPSTAAG